MLFCFNIRISHLIKIVKSFVTVRLDGSIPSLTSVRRSGVLAYNDPMVAEVLKALEKPIEGEKKKRRMKKEEKVEDPDYLLAKQLQEELCRRSSRGRGSGM